MMRRSIRRPVYRWISDLQRCERFHGRHAAREIGCATDFQSSADQPDYSEREPEPMEADLAVTLQFCEERFDLLSLSLCLRELWCSSEISRSLSSCFVHVDCKIPERSGRTLGSLFAWAALLTSSDVAEGAIPLVTSAIVQLLACGTDEAVALR